MKFLPVALAGLFLSSFTDAKPFKKTLGKNKVLDKKKLMRGAKRYVNGKIVERKLDQEEFEITGDYSIQFNQCISLKTNAEDLFDEDLYQATYQGKIVAEKSFVIFNVCQTEYCSYDAYDMQYVTDLATYIGALAEYLPAKKEAFCEQCEANEDYCNREEEEGEEEEDEEGDEEEEDEDEDEDDEDRKRRLAKKKRTPKKDRKLVMKKKGRKLANYIDCQECFDQGCYDEEQEGDDQVQDEDVVGWIQEMAECKQTEQQYGDDYDGDYDLYAGFICNSYGTGVEIAVFVDEDCSMYLKGESFNNVMDEEDEAYYQLSSDMVTYPFTNDIDCMGDVEYDEYNEDGEEEEEEDEDEENEANEICQQVVQENAVPLDTCGNDGDEDEEEEEEDENQVNYDWYEYDISERNAEEIENVCKFLQEWDGEYNPVYEEDEEGGGGFYDYTVYDAEAEEASASSGGASAGMIVGIVILVAAVAIAAVFAVKAMSKSSEDSKAEPLTKKSGGAMA